MDESGSYKSPGDSQRSTAGGPGAQVKSVGRYKLPDIPPFRNSHSSSQHLAQSVQDPAHEAHVPRGKKEVSGPSPMLQPISHHSSTHSPMPSIVTPSLQEHVQEHVAPDPQVGQQQGRHGRRATACDWCRARKQGCSREQPCRNCRDHGRASECTYSIADVSVELLAETTMDPSAKAKKRKIPSVPNEERLKDAKHRYTHHPGDERRQETGAPALDSHVRSLDVRSSSETTLQVPEAARWISSTGKDQLPPLAAPIGGVPRHRPENYRSGRSLTMSPDLMEESEARGVGSRRPMTSHLQHQKDGQDEERTFFGTSHFGPQLAARVAKGLPSMPLYDIRHPSHRGTTIIDDTKPYTLITQTRALLPHVPRKEACDTYVQLFFERYNSYMDIIYQPDFMIKYDRFWTNVKDVRKLSHIDLRQLALLFVILAFGILLEHEPAKTERRLSLIETGEMSGEMRELVRGFMSKVEKTGLSLQERQSLSLTWSWAAKRALSEASGFYGESLDTVQAGALLSLYFVVCRRPTEVWTVIGTAIRAAQAQGQATLISHSRTIIDSGSMHVDGGLWQNMPAKEAEIRRRLWAQLYIIDRSVSLFLGRPLAIQDDHQATDSPSNIDEAALNAPLTQSEIGPLPRGSTSNPYRLRAVPLSQPTLATFLILHHRLAGIIGRVQLSCFGLRPRQYRNVQECEQLFQNFRDNLPPHFRLDGDEQDHSLDDQAGYEWLVPQRQTLISKFHLARISLHRPYLLRSFRPGREGEVYAGSRHACVTSAVADIKLRTTLGGLDPLDRFKWMTVASGFNPATIIGIICVRQPGREHYEPDRLLDLLEKYIALEEKTVRRDAGLEQELYVLRMMVRKAKNPGEVVVPTRQPLSAAVRPPFGASAARSVPAVRHGHGQTPSTSGRPLSMPSSALPSPLVPRATPGPTPYDSASGYEARTASYPQPAMTSQPYIPSHSYTFPVVGHSMSPGIAPAHVHPGFASHGYAEPPPSARQSPQQFVTHPVPLLPGSGAQPPPAHTYQYQYTAQPYSYMYPSMSSVPGSADHSTPQVPTLPHLPFPQPTEDWMNHTAWQDTAEAFPEDTGDFLEWFHRFTGEEGWTGAAAEGTSSGPGQVEGQQGN